MVCGLPLPEPASEQHADGGGGASAACEQHAASQRATCCPAEQDSRITEDVKKLSVGFTQFFSAGMYTATTGVFYTIKLYWSAAHLPQPARPPPPPL